MYHVFSNLLITHIIISISVQTFIIRCIKRPEILLLADSRRSDFVRFVIQLRLVLIIGKIKASQLFLFSGDLSYPQLADCLLPIPEIMEK